MTAADVPAARPVFSPEDRQAIAALIDLSLTRGSLTLGELTERLEAAVASTHRSRFAVAVSSGTAALEIILRSLRVAGQEVVVPTNTFFATAGAVLHAGGRVRLADVSPATMALSPETLEDALTDDTAGVVAVHVGGAIIPDIEEIAAVCRRRGLWLVEDAAHAHGASSGGRMAGAFGVAAALSLYPTKVVTSGEGGVILTDDENLREEAVLYRDQGKAGFLGGDHVRMGYAWRMSELHAAVGLVQWARLEQFIAVRQSIAALYDAALSSVPGIVPLRPPATGRSNYYKYVALLDRGIDRGALKGALRAKHRVALSGEIYAKPLHAQPVLASLAGRPFPNADDVCARHICLPIHSDMRTAEAEQVLSGVAEELAGLRR